MKIQAYRRKSPFFRFLVISRSLEKQISLQVKRYDISFIDALCLIAFYMEDEKDLFLKQFAEIFGLNKSMISYSVSRLEELHFIKRAIHPTDKRRYRFQVSEKAKRIIPKLMECFDKLDESLENKLSSSERKTLTQIFDKLDLL